MMNKVDSLLELRAQISRREYQSLGLVNLNPLRYEIERAINKLGTVRVRVGRKRKLR